MKLQEQVCTLEQAKRLKELGVSYMGGHKWGYLKYPAKKTATCTCLRTDTGDHLDRFIMHFIDNADGQFHWDEGTHDGGQDHSRCELYGEDYPAFTVAELGAALPTIGFHCYPGYECKASILSIDRRMYNPYYKNVPDFTSETEAQSRAAMLIYLLENNLTTPEEVNKRLQP